jgi:signal transduction histidine kinase/CheY-like chemotaxis protein
MTEIGVNREDLVLAEQVRSLDQAMVVAPFALMLVAAVLVYALWGHVDTAILLGWLAAVVVWQGGRLAQSLHYRRSKPPPQHARWWANMYTVATLLSGCIWGVGAWLMFVPDSLSLQALLTMVLTSLVSGSVATNTAYRPVHFAFALPVLLPLAARNLMQGDSLHIVTAFLVVVFLGFLLMTGYRINARVSESIRMRFENMELIEELKRQKFTAERAQHDAEEANQAKSRFLAAASHDLRQPLHALGLFTGVLEQTVQQPQSRGVIQNMRASVDALEALFNELLDISKLDAGVITPNITTFALAPLFERVRNDFEPQAVARGLVLRVRPTTLATTGDAILLERILRNLVANAIRYTPSGRVLLGCRRRAQGLEAQVLDTGIGIPEGERARIFEEFYQIGNPERDRGKGLGLGLAIVKRLAELLGYTVRIDSRLGAGSCFAVRIPRALEAPAATTSAQQAPSEANQLADQFVLVVDDDASAREGLRALLKSWRCRVLASEGLAQLEASLQARGEHPDVIVTDYRLRDGSNGIDVINALRSRYGLSLPAVVLTGDMRQAATNMAHGSAVEWLQKPVAPERLRQTLARVLQIAAKSTS